MSHRNNEKQLIIDNVETSLEPVEAAAVVENNSDQSNVNNDNEYEEDDDDDVIDDIPEELIEGFFEELENTPMNLKLDYVEALLNAPEIVHNESNPVIFLRYADYDPGKAAMALCDYWSRRVKVFGVALAHKPMTLGDEGACKGLEQAIVKMPYHYRVLPPDDYGRTVLCSDMTNINLEEIGNDQMVFVKYLWYFFHQIYVRKVFNQRNGCVIIAINRGVNYLRKATKFLFNHDLPIKISVMHFVQSTIMSKTALPVMKHYVQERARSKSGGDNDNSSSFEKPELVVHSSLKLPAILAELKSYGLQSKNLPKSIGGKYNVKPSWVVECEKLVDKKRTNFDRKERCHNK